MIVLDPNGEKMNLMALNVGPTHPATHHCVRLLAALDGETIVAGVHEIGFMHRGFEKMVERGTWQQVIPYTDRLNYCSAMMNNIAFCRAVENMYGIEIPERTKVLRVIVNELYVRYRNPGTHQGAPRDCERTLPYQRPLYLRGCRFPGLGRYDSVHVRL